MYTIIQYIPKNGKNFAAWHLLMPTNRVLPDARLQRQQRGAWEQDGMMKVCVRVCMHLNLLWAHELLLINFRYSFELTLSL
jgi:hypothetical protein